MEFHVKRRGQPSKDEKAEKRIEREKHSASSEPDEHESVDGEEGGQHGGEEDGEEEQQKKAGQHLIDAIKGGDGHEVFKAHRHLHNVHLTTGPIPDEEEGGPAEGGGDDGMGRKVDLVTAIKNIPLSKTHKKD